MHEELETETIKSSIFRHKLTFFDFDLKKEIFENVKAARDSNMEVINSLKAILEKLNSNIKALNTKDKELTEEINIMKYTF